MSDMVQETTAHPTALVEGLVGDGTVTEAFAFIGSAAVVGAGCTIASAAKLRGEVRVGDGSRIGDGAVVGEDGNPDVTVIGAGVSVGANAVVRHGVEVGSGARVGAGSVVTRHVPPGAIVEGVPAKIVGYVDTEIVASAAPARVGSTDETGPGGVRLVQLTAATDLRGSLVAAEFEGDVVPFVPRRTFVVYGVPSEEVRGAHAHYRCEQLLVCVSGSVHALVDDGTRRREYVLDSPQTALYMPPMTWGTQYRYSADSVLMVLASRPYEAEDYIRDHDQFLAEVRRLRS